MPFIAYRDPSDICLCFICNKAFYLGYNGHEDLLQHLYFSHKVMVYNKPPIPDIKEYMRHYREVYLSSRSLYEFTKDMTVELPDRDGEFKPTKLYLLGDFLPDDDALRRKLHKKRLELGKRQMELDQSNQAYKKHCFYCHQNYKTTRMQFVDHLKEHGFDLGRSTGMVFIEKLVNVIEHLYKACCCLCCGEKFSNTSVMEEHMVKEGHKKINPDNAYYDQFYIINYGEYGKTWKDLYMEKGKTKKLKKNMEKEEEEKEEDSSEDDGDDEDDWSWSERILCLFCPKVCHAWDGSLFHMKVMHNFDFKSFVSDMGFYHQVKVVNYIRHRVSCKQCIVCEEKFLKNEKLLLHMQKEGHFCTPKQERWDRPEYFKPVMEDDNFLIHLEDEDESEEEVSEKKLECAECASVDKIEKKAVAGSPYLVENEPAVVDNTYADYYADTRCSSCLENGLAKQNGYSEVFEGNKQAKGTKINGVVLSDLANVEGNPPFVSIPGKLVLGELVSIEETRVCPEITVDTLVPPSMAINGTIMRRCGAMETSPGSYTVTTNGVILPLVAYSAVGVTGGESM